MDSIRNVSLETALTTRLSVMKKFVAEEYSSTFEPFYVIDLADVVRKYYKWKDALPRVEPFYAVKCNSDDSILDTLAALGTGFDCASRAEMQAMIGRGVAPEHIIYAHPCKPVPHLLYAKEHGVQMMTFDNEHELQKVATHYPEAKLVLRALVDDSFSVCRLGTKFGCPPSETWRLLLKAKDLGLTVIGVSFHVGSGCTNAKAFSSAVATARVVFDQGLRLGFPMSLLDLGGGFPGTNTAPVSFEAIHTELNEALDLYFPQPSNVRIIAEPGRYFVASACSLAVNITAKRSVFSGANIDVSTCHDLSAIPPDEIEESFMYYVNDGVYGSFNCILFDHQVVKAQPMHKADGQDAAAKKCSIWGPTCDSMDCITSEAWMQELKVGDWMFFDDMGAYTMAASSTFNGFARPGKHYIFTSTMPVNARSVDEITTQMGSKLSLRMPERFPLENVTQIPVESM